MIVYKNDFENGFGGNVTVEGDAVIKPIDSGHAAYFDGTGDGLRLTDSSLNLAANDFKVSFRMKAVGSQDYYSVLLSTGTGAYSNGTYSGLLEIGNGANAGGVCSGSFMGYTGSDIKIPGINVNNGAWHTIEIGRTAGKGFFSVDGTATSNTLSIANDKALIDLRNLRIGRWAGNDLTDNNFTGYIDDLTIETTAPTSSQSVAKVNIPGLFNTGAGLTNGDIDFNYHCTKIQGTADVSSGFTYVNAGFTPNSYSWVADTTTSHWLTPSPDAYKGYDHYS
ncbi:MAG: hypothetical protein ACR2HF_13255, partial [Methylococcaceae bacterium]